MVAAIYCRLSKEDDGKQAESESIQNQKSLLIKYAVEKGWDIHHIFSDEDYSGADSDRPAFRQLIHEAEQRKFDIVLVKTQSRFTRDMELVERYIHGKFVEWGIRFVALLDNVDTDVKGNKKARQINGLMNEWYLEDLSENIRSIFDHKRENGQYIGNFATYGYLKSPADKHKLIIDPVAAEVVKRIYSLYLAGHGKQHIAHILNEDHVPNPTKHKQSIGMEYVNGFAVNDHGLWNRTSVGRILRERMYTGDMVQGRRKKISYKSKRQIRVPEQDWFIVPNTHEAIIDKDTFATVNRLLRERTTSSGVGAVHALAGKVRCMDCGSTMVKTSNTYKGERRAYLRCKLHSTDKTRCSNHCIRLDAVEQEVLTLLRRYVERYYDRSGTEKLLAHDRTGRKMTALQTEVRNLSSELERRDKAMRDLYLDKSRGLIDEKQFIDLNTGYLQEKIQLQKRHGIVTQQCAELESRAENTDATRQNIAQWLKFESLSRELVADFVNFIEVGTRDPVTKRQSIRIHWLF